VRAVPEKKNDPSDADRRLVEQARFLAGQTGAWADRVLAGEGDAMMQHRGKIPAGSLRDHLRDRVAACMDLLNRAPHGVDVDRFTVEARETIHTLLKEARTRRSSAKDVVERLRMLFIDWSTDPSNIDQSVVERCLARKLAPGEAANALALAAMREDFQVQPDSVREGARERLRRAKR
jgi:hypothetical protein